MATTLKQPTDRRGWRKLIASLHRLPRRERIAARAVAVAVLLLLAVGVGSAVGGGLPFVGDDEEARGASSLPSDWAGLEPLLPLAPSLKDIAALKRTAAGEASGVVAAESGGGGGGRGALRVRALPEGAGAATDGGARVAEEGRPSGRPRPAAVGAPAPPLVRVPSVRRILATRLGLDLGRVNDLRKIIQEDLRGLRGLPIDIDIDIDIPRIDPSGPSIPSIGAGPLPGGGPLPLPGGNPLPVGGSLPGVGRGGSVLNLTVVDSRADSRFDVLLVARGRRLLEAYRFRDRDIAGLAAQINLRSAVLVADVLRDGKRLERVTGAPLRPDAVGRGSGPLGAGLAADGSRDGTGIGAASESLASARSRANGRPASRRGGRRSGGRSDGGGSSSRGSSPSSGSGSGTPRRSIAPRRSTPTRPHRSSLHPKPKKLKPRKSGGRPKSSRHGHGKGHGKSHGKKSHGKKSHGKHDDDDDGDDGDDGDDD